MLQANLLLIWILFFVKSEKMQIAAVVTISEPAQNQNNLSQCFETEVQKPTDVVVATTCISFWFDEKYSNEYKVW